MKAYNKLMEEAKNGTQKQEQQPPRLKKVHLEQDEFTEHKIIEDILVDFIQEARHLEDHYQGHRKRMIQTVALAIADELTKIGKTELICQISTVLIRHLKHSGIKWNAIYLRRVLDERYKDPTNRFNAQARKKHFGVPQDTGLTAEQLQEQRLNRKPSGWGQEYTIRTVVEYPEVFNIRTWKKQVMETWITNKNIVIERVDQKKVRVTMRIPVIAVARPAEQNVTLQYDRSPTEPEPKKHEKGIDDDNDDESSKDLEIARKILDLPRS